MSRNSLLKTDSISEVSMAATGLKPTILNHLAELGSSLTKWLSLRLQGFESRCSHLFNYNWIFLNANFSDYNKKFLALNLSKKPNLVLTFLLKILHSIHASQFCWQICPKKLHFYHTIMIPKPDIKF